VKVLVNDHSGHAFPVHLSRELARSGYKVAHTYSANFQSPKGDFSLPDDLKSCLKIIPIYYSKEFNKYSILSRRKQEFEFAGKLIEEIKLFRPEVIINCNTPLFAQNKIQQYCLEHNIKFILWYQDAYSIAITKILQSKFSIIGRYVGKYFQRLERLQLKHSNHIISITPDFNKLFASWNVDLHKTTVIPNWAPIEEIPLVEKNNSWSKDNGLDKYFCFIYSGTLGLKHNPMLLLNLADHFKNRTDVKVVVISEGVGADFLKKKISDKKIQNLVVLPFQKFVDMPKVLGSSDVLVGVLEPQAGVYSVPSKILAYMCAGKPILLSVPFDNLSSKIIMDNQAGICADPKDLSEFIKSADRLYSNADLRTSTGRNARKYAEENFKISVICNKFIQIIQEVTNSEKTADQCHSKFDNVLIN
jgi:colanic acid biosynthesis glycosyl transferase WcaI